MRAVAVIPARYGASRFPGKPLAPVAGRPLVEHVYRRVCMCSRLAEVVVATDDERILKVVEGFGGRAIMTSSQCRSGSDRLAEAASRLRADLLVNVQGDEPLMDPRVISAVLEPFTSGRGADISTAASPLEGVEEYRDPHVVKVLLDVAGRAVYFSRSPVPHGWTEGEGPLRHIGIYCYTPASLARYAALPAGVLERLERLEQLRALENGMSIAVARVEGYRGIGVDRPEDVARVEEIMRRQDGAGFAPGPSSDDGEEG